ncbi:MAG TPA: hypothetical protein VK127_01310 [Nitrososphaerales archaeon]|nr:hypothetical protein [Nitrososphaerales archaeon]
MKEPLDKWDEKLVEHLLKHGDDLSFTKYFWNECEANPLQLRQFARFATAIREASTDVPAFEISLDLGVTIPTVESWIRLQKKPKLAHYLSTILHLGPLPPDWVWLSINTSYGHGLPLGPLVKVPKKIASHTDVEDVIAQLNPLPGITIELDKQYAFGFFLGMLVGDCGKSKRGTYHRHVGLTLSMRYETSLRLGDFTCECARTLGLRMHRISDLHPKGKPNGFYDWVSQASPLIDWMYNVCLGLRDDQVTTYSPISAGWVMESSVELRTGFLQGLAESDGSVNLSGQEMEFWVGPSWDFTNALLTTFGLKAFRSRKALTLSKHSAVRAFDVPVFSPFIKTVRYERLRRLAQARRLKQGDRLDQSIRSKISRLAGSGLSVSKIIQLIAEEDDLMIAYDSAQRWARRSAPNHSPHASGF